MNARHLADVIVARSHEWTGRVITSDEAKWLAHVLQAVIPPWLIDVLQKERVTGSRLIGVSESGHEHEFDWMEPQDTIDEATQTYPGIIAIHVRLLPVGAEPAGSGDQYYLDCRESTLDPPLVRVLHDVGPMEVAQIDQSVRLIARSAAQFVSGARIE